MGWQNMHIVLPVILNILCSMPTCLLKKVSDCNFHEWAMLFTSCTKVGIIKEPVALNDRVCDCVCECAVKGLVVFLCAYFF